MSIDWLPLDETRRFSHHIYTEPCWATTKKGTLQDQKVKINRLYDIFTKYEQKSKIFAEGNFDKTFKLNKVFMQPNFVGGVIKW